MVNLVSQKDSNENELLPEDTFRDHDESQTSFGTNYASKTTRRIKSSEDEEEHPDTRGVLGSSSRGDETFKRKKFIFKKRRLSNDESSQHQNNDGLMIKKAMCYDFKLKNFIDSDDSD